MSERKQTIVHLFIAAIMLFAVSAYRQVSMHYWSNDIVRPYIVYVVYAILLFWWQHSINMKILQKGMQIHLTIQNMVGLFYLTVRFVQDAFLYTNIPLMRFTGYFIHILAVLYPLFGLYAAFYLGKGESYRINRRWFLMLIPALALITMALTDELHHFLCYIVPEEPQPNLYFHPYIVAYIILSWAFGLVGFQVYVITKRCGVYRSKSFIRWLIPLYEPILFVLFSIPYIVTNFTARVELVEYSAGMIFIAILCWELYILVGLIPVNTRYDEVFRKSTIAMQILGWDGKQIAASENAAEITPEVLSELSENTHAVLGDAMLHLHKTENEYVIWKNDFSEIHETIQELRDTNATLEQGGDLIDKEIQVRSEETEVQARNNIYDSLTDQVSDQLLLLKKLLSEKPKTPEEWNRISLVGTYIKRFCNLQLIYLENGCIPSRDLQISLNDMIDCMERIGILASLDFKPSIDMDAELILHAMRILEQVLEDNSFQLRSVDMTVSDTVSFKVSGENVSFKPFVIDDKYRIEVETISDIYISCGEGSGC